MKEDEEAPRPLISPVESQAGFSVEWERAEESKLSWFQAVSNFPDPITPLDFGFLVKAVEVGSNLAAKHFKATDRGQFKLINSYAYFTVLAPPDSSEVREKRQGAVDRVEAAMSETGAQWSTNWLPELQKDILFWDRFDLPEASAESLSDHLLETERRLHRAWEIHFLLINPVILALHLFEEMHEDLWPEEPLLKAHELLLGFENKTVAGNRWLKELGEIARSDTRIGEALMSKKLEDVFLLLDGFPEGQKFRSALDEFLNEYGQRSDSQMLSVASWLESPYPVVQALRAGLTSGESKCEPVEVLVERRERRLEEIREELEEHPPLVSKKFRELLECAQVAQSLSEDHNYWIDIQVTFRVRQVCLELGRRQVAQGFLERAEDVFYLTLTELKEASCPESGVGFIEKVKSRRKTEDEFRQQTPPPILGTPPTPEEFLARDNALNRAYAKMAGPSGGPIEASKDSDILNGFGVSSGTAVGRVKVLNNQEDAVEQLKMGDILVTGLITSFWVPLFSRISGLVTAQGGMLSHGAVVAREHGLPAVSGVVDAMEQLRDGQLVEINGDQGTVRLLPDK
jgi:phosphohistidine swiveling domain-containing protein